LYALRRHYAVSHLKDVNKLKNAMLGLLKHQRRLSASYRHRDIPLREAGAKAEAVPRRDARKTAFMVDRATSYEMKARKASVGPIEHECSVEICTAHVEVLKERFALSVDRRRAV
jgi:hypothetical protein